METSEVDPDGEWRSRFRVGAVRRYGFALVAVGAAAGASLLMRETLYWEPSVLYVGAVAATAFFAGFGPALLATILSVAAIEFVFLSPSMSFELHRAEDLIILATVGGIGLAISWLAERLERSRDQVDRHRREAESAARRTALLSEATRVVGEAESYEDALRELPELLCRRMAEYAVTYACDPEAGDSIRRVGVAHADPDQQPIVKRLLEHRRPSIEDPHGAGAVIRSGEPFLMEQIQDDALERAAGEDTEYLELLRRLDPVSSILVPLRARGRTLGALAVATTGPTGRRYDEEDLDLTLELGYRAALVLDNLRLLEEARAATRTRERIMAVVAHDLRSPLSAVVNAAEVLGRPGGAERMDVVADALERASGRALDLVEDLVDVSRMEAGEYDVDPRPMRVEELLEDAVKTAEASVARNGVRLAVEPTAPDERVRADGEGLRRVFANLIENACRFSPEDGVVRIEARPREDEVVFSVADEGPGIAREDVPHVFEQFWQGRHGGGGAGLGLAIVRGIVEAHGGRVWAEPGHDRGATLCFTLPRCGSGTG